MDILSLMNFWRRTSGLATLPQESHLFSILGSTEDGTAISIIDICCHTGRLRLRRMDNVLNTELWDASKRGDVDEVQSLIERGADVSSGDRDGATSLHWACRSGSTAIASLLIERGVDVNSSDNDGVTSLYKACFNGHADTVSLLIGRGADINIRDNDGWPALHFACYNGHTAIASLLIERGSKVDRRDNEGHTALYVACYNGCKVAATLLIRSKADICIQSKDGRAPLDLQPEWREELTQLYEEVNRDWLARKSFLFVLIGCNHIESESNEHNASKQVRSGHSGASRGRVTRSTTIAKVGELRDEALRTVYRNIAMYL